MKPPCIGTIKLPLSVRGWGYVTYFPNFRTPLITFERKELSASKLVQTQRTEPPCVGTIKRPLSVRGWCHVTYFPNFGTPLITFEGIGQSASDFVQIWRRDPSCVGNIKRPLNGRGLVTWPNLEIFGPPNNFWTNWAIRFEFGTVIENGPLHGQRAVFASLWALFFIFTCFYTFNFV